MLKSSIRSLYLKRRKALTASEIQSLSDALYQRTFLDLDLDLHKVFHIYLPIVQKNEIDTWPIIHRLWQLKKQVIVPLIQENNQLKSALLTPDTPLNPNFWGIPEPRDPLFRQPEDIDLVFLPLLAFDRTGHRVGYGRGYYDRFLVNLRPDAQKIGLSLFDPIPTISPVDPWDQVMDACVTPGWTYRFSQP